MKYVREHINEKFSEDSDAVQDMGIGELGQLQQKIPQLKLNQLSPNEMLIIALKDYRKFSNTNDRVDLIKYALKTGANQLWYKQEETRIPYPISYLYRIKKVSIDKWDIKVTYQCIWQAGDWIWLNEIGTSKKFISSFFPVTDDTLTMLDNTAKNIKIAKKAIDELK